MTESVEWRFGLTRRGAAAVALVAAVTFVLGTWVGLWMIPAQALDVPMHVSEYGPGMEIAYQPVPTYLPYFSLLVGGVGVYVAWQVSNPPDDVDD